MVNVVVNDQIKNNVTYNVGTGNVDFSGVLPDNLEKAASEVGLTGLANQINQESQEYDDSLKRDEEERKAQNPFGNQQQPMQEQDDSGEEESENPKQRQIKKKKNRSQDRFAELALRYGQEAEQRRILEEQLSLEREESSFYKKEYLKSTQVAYNGEIDKVSDVLIAARKEDNDEVEKEAFNTLIDLKTAQKEAERNLHHIEKQAAQQQQDRNQAPDPRENLLMQLYDRKELESEALDDWLEENPECNPFHSDFDLDYASEVARLKKTGLNPYLVSQRQRDKIGKDEYYDLLNATIDVHFGRSQYQDPPQPQYQPQPQPQYQEQNYNQQRSPQMPMYRVPLDGVPGAPVSSVNRAGYASNIGQSNSQGLPELNAQQRDFALKWPIYTERSEQITNPAAKIEHYRRELARMNGGY